MAQCKPCESVLTLLLLFLAADELHGLSYEREEPNWGAPRKIASTGIRFPSDNENTQFTQTRRFPVPEIPQRTNVETFSMKEVTATGESHGFLYEREETNWGASRKIARTGIRFPSDNENTQFSQTRRFPVPEIPQRTNVETFSTKDAPATGKSHGFSYGSKGQNFGTDDESTKFIQTRGFPLPDLPGRPNVRTFSLKDVPVCKNTTFCEQPPFYPDELVNLAVEMDKKYKYSASVDEIEDSEDTEGRIDLIDEVPVCASEVQIVYPKTAVNRYSQWLFVVNNNKFTQGVRIEACRSEESDSMSNTPDGYVTICKQQYVFRHLAAILPDGSMKMDLFRFPSGCRAYLKFSNPYDNGYFNGIN